MIQVSPLNWYCYYAIAKLLDYHRVNFSNESTSFFTIFQAFKMNISILFSQVPILFAVLGTFVRNLCVCVRVQKCSNFQEKLEL